MNTNSRLLHTRTNGVVKGEDVTKQAEEFYHHQLLHYNSPNPYLFSTRTDGPPTHPQGSMPFVLLDPVTRSIAVAVAHHAPLLEEPVGRTTTTNGAANTGYCMEHSAGRPCG